MQLERQEIKTHVSCRTTEVTCYRLVKLQHTNTHTPQLTKQYTVCLQPLTAWAHLCMSQFMEKNVGVPSIIPQGKI